MGTRCANHLSETGLIGQKINNACHIKSNDKQNASFINHNSTPWKAIAQKVDLKDVGWKFWLIWKDVPFNVFVHWLLIHMKLILFCRKTTDVKMTICVVKVLLQLDKVPLNVYGSFGHAPVITYWYVDNYGYHLWQILVSYCRSTSYHKTFWSEPETAGNIEKHKLIYEPL